MLLVIIVLVLVILACSLKVVTTGNVYVVERLGKYHSTLQPGWNVIIPFIDIVRAKVSLKQQIIEIEPQSVITKDNVGISIDSVVFYTVISPKDAVYGIENYRRGVSYSSAINMRDCVGSLMLDEILSERAKLNMQILSSVQSVTRKYGIEILSVEIKNIIPPQEITSAMEQVMTSERKKRAAILQAEGQKQASISIAEGAKQSQILVAEAEKEANIRRAEGSRQSQLLEAEGKANALKVVAEAQANVIEVVAGAQAKATMVTNTAILKSGTNEIIIALKQVDALVEMAKNPSSKLIIPSESISTLGSISAIAETIKLANKEVAKEVVKEVVKETIAKV
ncbi:MAG TPA: SPFH domain-containing protein [Clostridium sp.]